MGYTTERIGGAGKALSGSDVGVSESSGWHGGAEEDMQKAPKKYQERVFEEFNELEEQRAKEALELVQKEHTPTKQEGEGK